MTDTWEPEGVGWEPIRYGVELEADGFEYVAYKLGRAGETWWKRPLSKSVVLPTEPYTVIRVKWRYRDRGDQELLLEHGRWWEVGGDSGFYDPDDLSAITGFEVLAQPRAVTRLEIVTGVIDFFRREAGADAGPDDWRNRAANTIAAEWDVS